MKWGNQSRKIHELQLQIKDMQKEAKAWVARLKNLEHQNVLLIKKVDCLNEIILYANNRLRIHKDLKALRKIRAILEEWSDENMDGDDGYEEGEVVEGE